MRQSNKISRKGTNFSHNLQTTVPKSTQNLLISRLFYCFFCGFVAGLEGFRGRGGRKFAKKLVILQWETNPLVMTTEVYHIICEYLSSLIEGTEWQGHVYAVGGCCRDEVMQREINDIDLAIDLENGGIRFAKLLHKMHLCVGVPTTFERYGTAMLRLKRFPQYEIEMVQTRCGKYTAENAKDPGMVFGSVEDDCLRRDFTINSLYYNISTREFIDITGHAIDDIHNRVLRTPMEADLTFYDDPVRILRGIRMACSLGWRLDNDLIDAMRKGVAGLRLIKIERIRAEFEKMLLCSNPTRALDLLRITGAMRYVVPELEKTYRRKISSTNDTIWSRSLSALSRVQHDSSIYVRLAALFHAIGYIDIAKSRDRSMTAMDVAVACARKTDGILLRFKYLSKFKKEVTFLIRNQAAAYTWGPAGEKAKDRQLKRLRNLCLTDRRLDDLLALIHVVNQANPVSPNRKEQVPALRKRLARLRS
jgi:tRNA nucleotidyltransferase/poly(A) polymerase